MSDKNIEMEAQKLKEDLHGLEKYVGDTLEGVQSKLDDFIERFRLFKTNIICEFDELKNKENIVSSNVASFNRTESILEESPSTPNNAISPRYPRYVSPSIRTTPCKDSSQNGSSQSLDFDFKLDKYCSKTLILQSCFRGFLCRLVYNSKRVKTLRDVVTESRNLLQDFKELSQTDDDFKARLSVEVL
ncbi:hypothetical protein RF11_06241 [Thelohanellus kitauei]|uniref:Uncharacterized protein n=1 Tax=Thelohanellus kitauei TaxID=669202 RepID=A0A0C2IEK3_THEKT|nr:hypothetical protein RF11_06241 [Thelohanellus kitauei]